MLGAKSAGVYALVLAANKLTLPTISVSSGSATISKPSGASEVRYTIDGTDPRYSDSAKVYSSAVTVSSGTVVRAAAFADDKFTSSVAEKTA